MADNMTVNFHAGDETEIRVEMKQHGDGQDYFVIQVGPNMRDVTIFATPEFAGRLAVALTHRKLERVPTEAEAMFIGMVERELDEEGSCP